MSDAAVLVMALPMTEEDLAVEAHAFVAKEAAKCSVMVEEEIGDGELGKQVVQYIACSASTYTMTPDADGLTNYRECSRPVGLKNGGTTSIANYDELAELFALQQMGPRKTARRSTCPTAELQPHLASIFWHSKATRMQATKGGVTLKVKGGRSYIFP